MYKNGVDLDGGFFLFVYKLPNVSYKLDLLFVVFVLINSFLGVLSFFNLFTKWLILVVLTTLSPSTAKIP